MGRYEIAAQIGAGGMGEVYRALDTRLERNVAIKILSRDLAADPQFRERFEREGRAISQLSHSGGNLRRRRQSFRAEKPRPWAEQRYEARGPSRMFDLRPDGRRIALRPQERSDRNQRHVTFVFNVFDQLRATVR